MEDIKRIYFETSSVNYLHDSIFNNPNYSPLATKKLHINQGYKCQISNVTLWEIFLTKDERKRYDLFNLSRCLFYDTLICSTEEIVISYIKNGCPIHENYYELDSKSVFAKEWAIACKNLKYAFQPDKEQLEKLTGHWRSMNRYFAHTSRGYFLEPLNHNNGVSEIIDSAFLMHIFEKLLKQYGKDLTEKDELYISYSIQAVMIILCYGIGFDQQLIEDFWNYEKKTEPLERLEIASEKFPEIFFRGPLANITRMIMLQANGKINRGLYFDSLHSIYITYADLFFTNDKHFLKYKSENKNDPNTSKIMSIKELNSFNS